MMEIDPSTLSLEQLDAMMDRAARGEPLVPPPAPPAAEAEATPPAPAPEAPAPAAEATPPAPAAEEPKAAEEPDPVELHLEELEARQKYIEQLVRRREEIRRSAPKEAPPQTPASETTEEYQEAPRETPRPPPAAPPRRDEVTAYTVSRAVAEASQSFGASHPDAAGMAEEMKAHWQRSGFDPSAILDSDSPLAAQREAIRALEEAYWAVRASRAATARQELTTKRAAQVKDLEERKKQAAVSGATGAAAPPPAPKSIKDMTVDEIDKALQEATGGRW